MGGQKAGQAWTSRQPGNRACTENHVLPKLHRACWHSEPDQHASQLARHQPLLTSLLARPAMAAEAASSRWCAPMRSRNSLRQRSVEMAAVSCRRGGQKRQQWVMHQDAAAGQMPAQTGSKARAHLARPPCPSLQCVSPAPALGGCSTPSGPLRRAAAHWQPPHRRRAAAPAARRRWVRGRPPVVGRASKWAAVLVSSSTGDTGDQLLLLPPRPQPQQLLARHPCPALPAPAWRR